MDAKVGFLRFRLRLLLLVVPVGLVAFLLALFLYQRDDAPVGALSNAKAALERAGAIGAGRFAPDSYGLATQALNDGSMELAFQNGRFALLRDYDAADTLLQRANRLAVEAAAEAEGRQRSLDSLARFQHADLEEEILLCRDALDGTLMNFEAERYWAAADLALKGSWLLIGKGEYEEAMQSVVKGKLALKRAVEALAEAANNEKGKIGIWRTWVQETLSASRAEGNHALIVDKSAHKAYLVNEGKLVKTYGCDLGWNSAEQKYFQGDGATPEGKYKVTSVKHHSKYYRALLINYPNDTDKSRFAQNKRKGVISGHARIGALIEIHGGGGRDQDWTDGCIALTNKDMDNLLKYASVGTPVTIVRRSDTWP
jgi:hypothetical protein